VEEPEAEPKPVTTVSRSRNPFIGKSRVPQSQSPGPGVGRSKSFKEPLAPGPRAAREPGGGTGQARNGLYTSSLRWGTLGSLGQWLAASRL
jgi:hypothetical protein